MRSSKLSGRSTPISGHRRREFLVLSRNSRRWLRAESSERGRGWKTNDRTMWNNRPRSQFHVATATWSNSMWNEQQFPQICKFGCALETFQQTVRFGRRSETHRLRFSAMPLQLFSITITSPQRTHETDPTNYQFLPLPSRLLPSSL